MNATESTDTERERYDRAWTTLRRCRGRSWEPRLYSCVTLLAYLGLLAFHAKSGFAPLLLVLLLPIPFRLMYTAWPKEFKCPHCGRSFNRMEKTYFGRRLPHLEDYCFNCGIKAFTYPPTDHLG